MPVDAASLMMATSFSPRMNASFSCERVEGCLKLLLSLFS
jgi:hypothetical protein